MSVSRARKVVHKRSHVAGRSVKATVDMGAMTNWRGARRSVGAVEAGRSRAERLRLRPWNDPRLLLGILLVIGAAALGARAVSAADNTTEYWSISRAVRAGDVVRQDDLVAIDVKLTGGASDRYLAAAEELPAELDQLQWARDREVGDLVGQDDLVPKSSEVVRQLPLQVADTAMPSRLRRGDLVDVWVGSGPGDEAIEPATRLLQNARILDAGGSSGALDGGAVRSVLVEVPDRRLDGDIVAAVASGHVTLVKVP